MKSIACTISYGKTMIDYELVITNRKSLEIAVHPDKSVVVKAPNLSDITAIEEKVRQKARWIKKQIAYFTQFNPRTPKRRFVGGESHLYLGRKYRLKIKQSETDEVTLKQGYFHIQTVDNKPQHIEKLLNKWYRNKANVHFIQILEQCWLHFQHKSPNKPLLKIRAMKTRWGSLSEKGQMTLNLSLIKAPRGCIEYVVIHELCHLLHAHHGKAFYQLLNSLLPDWKKRKDKLEQIMA